MLLHPINAPDELFEADVLSLYRFDTELFLKFSRKRIFNRLADLNAARRHLPLPLLITRLGAATSKQKVPLAVMADETDRDSDIVDTLFHTGKYTAPPTEGGKLSASL